MSYWCACGNKRRKVNLVCESALITLPICAKWLVKAVAAWSTARVTPATSVASFTIEPIGT
jgi:hypothetical protein